jgi:hypothetical protein
MKPDLLKHNGNSKWLRTASLYDLAELMRWNLTALLAAVLFHVTFWRHQVRTTLGNHFCGPKAAIQDYAHSSLDSLVAFPGPSLSWCSSIVVHNPICFFGVCFQAFERRDARSRNDGHACASPSAAFSFRCHSLWIKRETPLSRSQSSQMVVVSVGYRNCSC